MQYIILCTSGFVDDVMFSYNGANGPESMMTHMLHPVCHVAAPVGHQTTMFGRVCQLPAPGVKSAVPDCILLQNTNSH